MFSVSCSVVVSLDLGLVLTDIVLARNSDDNAYFPKVFQMRRIRHPDGYAQ